MDYNIIEDKIAPIRKELESLETWKADILYQLILSACHEAYISGEINILNQP